MPSHITSSIRNLFISIIAIGFFSTSVNAIEIDIGAKYAVTGGASFFLPGGVGDRNLIDGSSFQFGENGIFYLDLFTSTGVAHLELGYDVDEFNAGGNVTLNRFLTADALQVIDSLGGEYDPSLDSNMSGSISPLDALLHINGVGNPNSNTLITAGIFREYGASADDFTFIGLAMNGIFRLGTHDGYFTIWNKQFDEKGNFLGATDFHLRTGAEVPEPATVLLLGSALIGAARRRRQA